MAICACGFWFGEVFCVRVPCLQSVFVLRRSGGISADLGKGVRSLLRKFLDDIDHMPNGEETDCSCLLGKVACSLLGFSSI